MSREPFEAMPDVMDGYTLTLVIIGAATVSYWFVKLLDKLDRPGK